MFFLVGATPKYCDLTHSKYWICSYLKLALAGNFCVCLLPRNGELPWIHHQSIAELPCATDHQALDYFSVPLVPSLQNRVITVRAVREPKIGQWRRRLGIIPPLYTFEDDPFLSFFHSKPSRLGKVYPLGHCHRRWYLYIYIHIYTYIIIHWIYIYNITIFYIIYTCMYVCVCIGMIYFSYLLHQLPSPENLGRPGLVPEQLEPPRCMTECTIFWLLNEDSTWSSSSPERGIYIYYTFSHGVYDVPGIYVTCMILLEYDGTRI